MQHVIPLSAITLLYQRLSKNTSFQSPLLPLKPPPLPLPLPQPQPLLPQTPTHFLPSFAVCVSGTVPQQLGEGNSSIFGVPFLTLSRDSCFFSYFDDNFLSFHLAVHFVFISFIFHYNSMFLTSSLLGFILFCAIFI